MISTKSKKLLRKVIRRAAIALLISYVGLVAFVFLYGTYHRGPIVGLILADHLLIRGPIQRYMDPVTPDDQMIKRFYSKRPAFESLVQFHREKCLIDPLTEKEYPEVVEIRQQIGLLAVENGKGALWLPDPYSENAYKQARAMEQEWVQTLRGTSPSDPARTSLVAEWKKLDCAYGAPKFYWEQFSADPLAKGLIYFPVEPKIENGELYRPSASGPDKPYHYEKVLESLDGLPKGFWRDQRSCTFRRVEPQWFLFVCPSYLKRK